ncbi:MAG: HAD family hydrolase, partial [Alphaproteobacteria bacterium]|nr:HAD family hydrolase [Alphaproteobacteria bacterium]
MTVPLKAVSFDLWDTIIDDDSDEPKRRAQGLRAKPVERRYLLHQALNRHQPVTEEDVNAAYAVADAAFSKAWKGDSITWTVAERLGVALKELGRELPADDLAEVADAMGRMEVELPPDTIDGIKDALEDLSRRYKLCIVSDTIVTPAVGLRALLDGHGLKQYFSGFAFSDEVGHSKPHPDMFNSAAGQLGVAVTEMVHIGDRDHNDIKGAQGLGMKAVLFTAKRDVDRETTSADAICDCHADLP